MIEEALYVIAKAHGGLTALIGTGDNIRFFPEADDREHSLPRVVYSAPVLVPVKGIWSNSGWYETPITFTAFGATAIEAKQVMEQVRSAFERYHSNGAVVGSTSHKIDDAEATGDGFADYDHDLKQYFEQVELEFFHN